jgi:hypothetical protein
MRKRLRVVGGALDGRHVEMDGRARRLAMPDPLPVMSISDSVSGVAGIAEQLNTVYTVRILTFGNTHIEFLSPEQWTDEQAFEHQFK